MARKSRKNIPEVVSSATVQTVPAMGVDMVIDDDNNLQVKVKEVV